MIRVSEHVKKALDEIKVEDQHTSYDSVIRSLLKNSEAKRGLKP